MSPNGSSESRRVYLFAIWASILLTALAIVDFIEAFFNAYQIQLLDSLAFSVSVPPALIEAQDSRLQLLAAIAIGLGLPTLVGCLFWFYWASDRAHTLAGEGMQYSPAVSVAWLLTPIVSLIAPFYLLKEIWKASTPGPRETWQQTPVSPILGVWWAVCFANAVNQYSRVPVALGNRKLAHWLLTDNQVLTDLCPTYREIFWGRLISNSVEIAACILTLVVIVSITRLQQRSAVYAQPHDQATD